MTIDDDAAGALRCWTAELLVAVACLCFAVLMMSLLNLSMLLAPIRGGQGAGASLHAHWIVEAVIL
jgi:hypothetical protein